MRATQACSEHRRDRQQRERHGHLACEASPERRWSPRTGARRRCEHRVGGARPTSPTTARTCRCSRPGRSRTTTAPKESMRRYRWSRTSSTPTCAPARYVDPVTSAHYRYLRGTSFFASPTVAGAAALLWAARPDLKNVEVSSFLERGACTRDATGWYQNDRLGQLDVAKSLELATGQSAADRVDLFALSFQRRGSARAGKHFTRELRR